MNNFSFFDWSVVFFGIAILALIGISKGRKQEGSSDFFLASRKTPVIVSVFSFVASEVSAMTIVGVPSVSFSGGWEYLQFFAGSAVSRILIAYFFIPVFYKYNCVTIYDFVGERFERPVQYSSSVFFFITRLLASGIRLYATALAISVITGWSLGLTIFLFLLFSFAFIGFGGMKSVLYTGVYQALSFYLMGMGVIFFIFWGGDFGFKDFLKIAAMDNKIAIINASFDFKNPNIFLLAILNGVFGSLAAFGTDYEMMQRLLTLKTRAESQKSVMYTIIATFFLVLIYLSLGSAIYAFLKFNSVTYSDKADKIVSYFAVNFLPEGLKGFVFLTVFLASVDLPLVSLSTSFINDIYSKVKKVEEKDLIKLTRISMVFFAAILGFIAFISQKAQNMLWFAFEINGVTSGSLLGVFLLGIFTKFKGSKEIIFSMIFSSILCLGFMIGNKLNLTNVPWSSFVIIGTFTSFLLPQLIGKFRKK